MSITLTPIQERLLDRLIRTGRYSSAAEVLSVALQLLEEREQHYEQWLEERRIKVQVGLDELDRGEGMDGEVVIERLREKLRNARESAS